MTEADVSESVTPQLLNEAVAQVDEAIYITDTEGQIEYVNPTFEEITGYEEAEVVGKTPHVLNSGEHDDAFFQDLWETILSEGRWESEILDETKHGDRIVLDQTISPITTADGEIQKFVAVARDVTDRRERERELELLKQIQSRVLRHDLRNQLQIIKFYAERCSVDLDTEHARRAERIVSITDELETVAEKTGAIERFLDQERTPTTIPIGDELRVLVETYRDRFPAASFTLECPPNCEIDAIPEVTFVFENLIDNAVRHNDSRSPTVNVTVESGEGATVATVSDDGPGIREQELLPLERREETALDHGTGIGLWLVSWILEKAEASLTYETGASGTEFTIRFPRPDR